MLVILLFVASIALTMIYFYADLSKSTVDSDTSGVLSKRQAATLPGSLTLTTSADGHNYLLGQDVDVVLGGDSKSIPVSGYDAVIVYDPTILTFVNATNGRDEYNIFTSKGEGKVMVTAGLKLSDKPSALSDSILASVRFKVIKAGSSTISLSFTPGSKTDSNMLSDKTEDILGSVDDVIVRVGMKVVVSKSEPTTIEGKKLTFVESTIPERGCADCQRIAIVSVEENGKSQDLKYVNGGFVGMSEHEKTIGDTVYQLEDMTAESITLIVAHK